MEKKARAPWLFRRLRLVRRLQFRIGTVQVAAVAGLVAVSVAGALSLGYVNTRETTRDLLRDRAVSIIDSTIRRVDSQLRPVASQAAWVAQAVADGRLDIEDRGQLEAFLAGTLAATPQVTGIGIIRPDGRITRYLREERRLEDERGQDRDEVGQMVDSARDLPGPAWGELIRPLALGAPAINLRVPLFRDGRFLGIAGMVVSIADLSLAFSGENATPGQVSYILYDRDWVLAHPLLIGWTPEPRAPLPLPRIEQLGDPILAEVWSDAGYRPGLLKETPDGDARGSVVAVDVAQHTYIFLNRTLTDYGPRPWTVGTYLDAGTEDALIERMRWTLVLGAGLLIVSILAAVLIGRMTSAPIREMAEAAAKVRSGDLAAVPLLPPSALSELNAASHAFNDMVEGLRERETMRELFGKYVPEEVAAALLREGGTLAPRTAEATVLFADMEDFTAFTESTAPERVVTILNDYFSALVGIVEAHGGVVTQFQGDAILATFNLPVARPDHAAQAVRAARRILAELEVRSFAGNRLRCRIGINTGMVTAGAVGAAGRLSYTVHGDAVNLASRLEVLNKDHGTRILIAGPTALRLDPGEFDLRPVGDLDIRGKSDPVPVFTLADAPKA